MGIPRFFAELIKKYPVHYWKDDVNIDYLFIDFNGIIYTAFNNIKKKLEKDSKDINKIKIFTLEKLILDEIINLTYKIVCEIAKPNKLLYISMDGPAPRAKMIQQRSRRYKSAIMNIDIENMIREKFNMDKVYQCWDPSSNAAPGTKFMKKLSDTIKSKIDSGLFYVNKEIDIIFSDSNVPGEGEHKFLNYIRKMDRKSEDTVCIYGNDGDLIVLATGLQKKNTFILREVQKTEVEIAKYSDKDFLYLDIDKCRSEIYKDMTKLLIENNVKNDIIINDKINIVNVTNDFVFLSFLFGNDFVESMHFLKIAGGGLNLLIGYYRKILKEMNTTLVNYDIDKDKTPTINTGFLKKIFEYISKSESRYMKVLQEKINKKMDGELPSSQYYKEEGLTNFEIDINRYQHLELYSSHNPLFNVYAKEFTKIDYSLSKNDWKDQYYKYFFNISIKKNKELFFKTKTDIVKNYLESLMFTLKYYFIGPPSWKWHYKYRVPPIPSDIFNVLKFNEFKDINRLTFQKNTKPYSPFQQLMLILSPRQYKMLPEKIGNLMIDNNYNLTQYYPSAFKIDAVAGMKYIYSEALLPEIDEKKIINKVKNIEKKLNSKDKERNKIIYEPYIKKI